MNFVADGILSASAHELFEIPGKVQVPLASHYKDTPFFQIFHIRLLSLSRGTWKMSNQKKNLTVLNFSVMTVKIAELNKHPDERKALFYVCMMACQVSVNFSFKVRKYDSIGNSCHNSFCTCTQDSKPLQK